MADPQITYPSNNATGVSTTPTISWSAVTGATKYKLQVDTANTFDSSAGSPLIEEEIVGGAGLLILDSHSATYKATQKPKQWGTLSAVQNAVRHNCEKWLGVPYESLKLCLPFWEGAGVNVHDLGDFGTQSSTLNSWKTDGRYSFNQSYFETDYYLQGGKGFTFLTSLERSVFNVNDVGLFSNITDANWSSGSGIACVMRRSGSSGGFLFYVDGSQTYFSSGDLTPVGERHSLAFVFKASETQKIMLDNKEISYDNHDIAVSYPQSPYPITIGTYYNAESVRRLRAYVDYMYAFISALSDTQLTKINEQPYRLLQPTSNRIISIGSAAPATSKQVTLAAGTTHYARVAADTP